MAWWWKSCLRSISAANRVPGLETTRQTFLRMLRCWRWWRRQSETLSDSAIRAFSRFPMLEIFVRQFLLNLDRLARMGLARRYVTVEDNLPYLRGRLLFREHLRQNLTNHARFAVSHAPLTVNRPANRLIHTALTRIAPLVRSGDNRQLLRQLTAVFVEVPQSADPYSDWREHHVDRSMPHYEPVMQWVGLFLFNHGLTTFSGPHTNPSLLFPMEQVFEDFVTHSFRRYQNRYGVKAQSPKRRLARIDGKDAFEMKPDISLMDEKRVVFILDAKWKDIEVGRRRSQAWNRIKTICISSTPTASATDATRSHWSTRELGRFSDILRVPVLRWLER